MTKTEQDDAARIQALMKEIGEVGEWFRIEGELEQACQKLESIGPCQ